MNWFSSKTVTVKRVTIGGDGEGKGGDSRPMTEKEETEFDGMMARFDKALDRMGDAADAIGKWAEKLK